MDHRYVQTAFVIAKNTEITFLSIINELLDF